MKKYFKQFKRWMGYNPPPFATTDGWEEFEQEFRKNAPIRYFINENCTKLGRIKNRIAHVKSRLRNRYISKTHILNMERVSKGTYYDSSEILKFAIFQVIIDFVETDLAQWSDEYKHSRNPFASVKPSSIDGIRVIEQNIYSDDMNDERKQFYKDLLEVYMWSKGLAEDKFPVPERPEEPWNEDDHSFMYFMTDECKEAYPEFHKAHEEYMTKVSARDDAYKAYEEEMLLRAIKIKDHLWT